MLMVRFQITDKAREADAFVAIVKRVRVVCFRDGTYEIAADDLKVVDEMNIPYTVVAKEGFDHACHSIRDSLASRAQ